MDWLTEFSLILLGTFSVLLRLSMRRRRLVRDLYGNLSFADDAPSIDFCFLVACVIAVLVVLVIRR